MSLSPNSIVFACVAAFILVSALKVVTSRNLVHAGFWLLPCLVGIGGFYALLDAHFLMVVQVLVYIGAILVLILFALMLTRDVMNPAVRQSNGFVGWAAALSILMAAWGVWCVTSARWPQGNTANLDPHGQTLELGKALIGPYALPFEVASVILLAALMGSIVVAKADREKPAPAKPETEREA